MSVFDKIMREFQGNKVAVVQRYPNIQTVSVIMVLDDVDKAVLLKDFLNDHKFFPYEVTIETPEEFLKNNG